MVRRALAAAGVSLMACGALAGTAAADTLYPKAAPPAPENQARDFVGGAGGWTEVESPVCSLLGAIPIPVPLLCSTDQDWEPVIASPQGSGSLRSSFQALANLGGLLFDGVATWRSPQFTITEASPGAFTGATLAFQRRADVQALIDSGGEAVTKVELVQVLPTPSRRTVLEETMTAENSTFAQTRAIALAPPAIQANSRYVLEFTTTFTSTAIQLAQGQIHAYYDNIELRAADGTDALNVPPSVTTLLATNVTDTSATLNAVIGAKGLDTTGKFEVRKVGNEGHVDVPIGGTISGAGTEEVNEQVTGLEKCANYEYRAVATNAQGTTNGNYSQFSTQCGPRIVTLPAAPVAATTAGLNATVNPNGPETFYRYQLSVFDDFRPEATFTTEERSAGSGTDAKTPLNEPISGLRPQTTYYYRALARNALGDHTGNTVTFATPQQSAPGAPGTPGTPGAQGPRGPSGVNRQDITLREGDTRALLRIRQSLVQVGLRGKRAGQLRFRIFCRKITGRTCAGTVKIRTIGKINPSSKPGVRKAKRRVTFSTFEYQLAEGKSGVAIAQMTPEKVDLLRLRRGLGKTIGVVISVQVTDSGGNRQTIVRNGRLRLVNSPR